MPVIGCGGPCSRAMCRTATTIASGFERRHGVPEHFDSADGFPPEDIPVCAFAASTVAPM